MKTNITPAAIRAARTGQLENFIAATTPGGIEAQEKRGQIEQSFLETLPLEGTDGKHRENWIKLGFEFVRQADDLFWEVKFPKGWRKQATDHSMWSNLLDDKGRKRAGIFYKAAFYDRKAHIHMERRYSFCTEPEGGWESKAKNDRFIGVVKDGENIIFRTTPTEKEPEMKHGDEIARKAWLKWSETKDAKSNEAKDWLDKQYPDWQSVLAYWD